MRDLIFNLSSIQAMEEQSRFRAMGFVSFSLHIVVIFGVVFAPAVLKKDNSSQHLDITIVTAPAQEPPKQADFVAAVDQQAGGNIDHVQPVRALQQLSAPAVPQKQLAHYRDSADALEQEVLRIDKLRQALGSTSIPSSKREQVRQISVATHQSRDAAYLQQWLERVERIGNLNYPKEARARRLHGDLQLLVAIRADGSLQRIELRRSSGHRVLDQAAVRIVQQAAPFAPLPENIRQDTDVLEIIRTWQFLPGERLVAMN